MSVEIIFLFIADNVTHPSEEENVVRSERREESKLKKRYRFAPQRKRNKSIQATFWMLKKENVISTELLERKGKIIKRVG